MFSRLSDSSQKFLFDTVFAGGQGAMETQPVFLRE